MLKKKMPMRRFKVLLDTPVTDKDELLTELDRFCFKTVEGSPSQEGLVDPAKPFDEGWSLKELPLRGERNSLLYLGFRMDSVSIPTGVVDKKLTKRIARERVITGNNYVAKQRTKELKDEIKDDLLRELPAKTTFIPVLLDIETGDGWLFNTSNKVWDKLESILSRVFGAELESVPFVTEDFEGESADFLTYIWWDSESDSSSEHKVTVDKNTFDVRLSIGDRAKVTEPFGGTTVTTVGKVEEARLAISKGGDVVKADFEVAIIKSHQDVVDRVYGLRQDGMFDTIELKKEEYDTSDLDACIICLHAAVKEAYAIVEHWFACYEAAKGTNRALTSKIKEKWGLGDFCSRNLDTF